jgi:opacity protein-like surface antigen
MDRSSRPLVTASMIVNQYYTDNVFYSRPFWFQLRRDDWVTVYLPSLNYRFENSRRDINLGVFAEIGRYATYSTEDYDDFDFYGDGIHRIDSSTRAAWGTRIGRDHEPRNSIEPSVQVGPVPPVYWWLSSYGALSREFNDNTVKLGVTFDRFDFVDSGGFNSDFRDRNMLTVGARLTRQRSERMSIFAESSFDLREYDSSGFAGNNILPARPDRDSRGARAAIGWQEYLADLAELELYGGIIYQTFDFDSFDDVVAADFGGDLSLQPMEGTSVSIRVQRELDETTLVGTSSYLRTSLSLQFQQNVRDDFRIYSGIAASMYEFQGTAREDQLTNAWIGFRKYITPTVFFGGEAAYEERESNLPFNDYTEARVMGRIGIERDDTLQDEIVSVAPGIDNAEVYIGVRGGVTSLMTMLDGERQPGQGGSLTTDFGEFGLSGDVVGGIGWDIARWYVGLEAEVGSSGARWDHSRLPGGRIFSVQREESYGGAMLLGRRLCSDALLYGRAGALASTFDTYYASDGSSSTSTTDARAGFQFGLGTRVPVSDHFSIGLEYVHAALNDYSQGSGSGAALDRFANTESTARLSGTYHFSATPRSYIPMRHDFSGAYWGLQFGHGGLSSFTTGNRTNNSELNADFGDTGVTGGLLIGCNRQICNRVLGVEFDADVAEQEWNHVRLPSGRTFSLEKNGSVGASMRAGLALNHAALVYGLVGVTGAFFDIDFRNPGGTANSDDFRAGLRYGGGLEVPLDDTFAIRFDYTFTEYGTLSLRTRPGVETYDTNESLFRIGALIKL